MADYPPGSEGRINHLRVRHMRLAQALVQLGSVHKAAKALHVSQPTASAMLKELEGALGGELFERTRNGVRPSMRGDAVLARLAAMLGGLDVLTKETVTVKAMPTLRVGCLYNVFFGPLQEYLRDFVAASRCIVDIVDGAYAELMQRLLAGELDCVIGRMPADPASSRQDRYFYQRLYAFEACVLAPAGHPLARKRKLTLGDLSAYEWILSKSASVLPSAFATAGLEPPKVRIRTTSSFLSLQLLGASMFLTTVPRQVGLEQQRLGLARVLPIRLPQILPPVAFIALQTSMLNPHVLSFWNAVRRVSEDRRFSMPDAKGPGQTL